MPTVTHARVIEVCKAEFTQRAKAFRKGTSADNWTLLLRAMLTLQQANQIAIQDRAEFCERLGHIPMGEWDERIVGHVTGRTIRQVMADRA